MKYSLYSKGIGMMIGLIFGAGIFAIPAAVARAGIWWGGLHFVIAFALMLVLQLWFAEIAFFSGAPGRFTGFVRESLGRGAERIAFISVIVGYYGALLAYGVLGGIFLHTLFPSASFFIWTLLFFAAAGLLAYIDFRKVGVINFYLTVPLVLFVLLLAGMSFSDISLANFSAGSSAFWFLPYGIFIFAFGGLAAIPETSDILKRTSMKDMRNVIFISMGITALLYLLFILAVVGVTGSSTTDDALTGLASVLGTGVIGVGAIIGFLAVFTSNLALAADMRNIFYLDYKIPNGAAWLLTILPAPLFFLAGISEFLQILSFVGAIMFGIAGILIFFMARRFHDKHPEHRHPYISTKNPLSILVVVFLLAGVFLELITVLEVLL